ncbi:hypothetical protein PtB15_12B287 [Puccinia triticina]|nr:hypothetical protein PtB15_12B287 [Puccinia triticina]
MSLNNSGRDIRLISLLMLIVLIGELSSSEALSEYFHWEDRLPGLNDMFPQAGSPAAAAADQADHHQPLLADHVQPTGLPAGSSASHNYPLPDNYLVQSAAQAHPSHGLHMSFGSDEQYGPGFWNPHDAACLLQLLQDGIPGTDGLAAAGAPPTDYGVPHVLNRQSHSMTGADPSHAPAVSGYTFPPPSDTTSGPYQRVQPVVESLKPQTSRGTYKIKQQRRKGQGKSHLPVQSLVESLRPQTSRGSYKRKTRVSFKLLCT